MANMSEEQYDKLGREIEEQKKYIEVIRQRLRDGIAQGDLRENSEVDSAKLDLQLAQTKLSNLEKLYEEAKIVNGSNPKFTFTIDGIRYKKTLAPAGVGEYDETVTEDTIVGNLLKTARIGERIEFTDILGIKRTLIVQRVL